MRSFKPILLVEDDQVDAMTVKRALKDINVINELNIANDGEEALTFLKNPENEKPGTRQHLLPGSFLPSAASR